MLFDLAGKSNDTNILLELLLGVIDLLKPVSTKEVELVLVSLYLKA